MAVSALIALLAMDTVRQHEFHEIQKEQAAKSVADIAGRIRNDPQMLERQFRQGMILGAHLTSPGWTMHDPDPALAGYVKARLGADTPVLIRRMPASECFFDVFKRDTAAGISHSMFPDCWYVQLTDTKGAVHLFAVDLLPERPMGVLFGPPYIELIILAGALLGIIAARIATAPLRRMESAARTFSLIADVEPIPVTGPSEVKATLATFNIMQQRVREALRERTQILASITHDLQTPLTRLRLRLEQVEPEELRERLIDDLSATLRMVREGLDLASSSETREPWSVVDIDSILSSLAEDSIDLGRDVRFTKGAGVQARVKPGALARCLGNLTDNAIKYAGAAELASYRDGKELVVAVMDRGPAMSDEEIAIAFQPFSRLSRQAGGTGIGLSIARAQAETFGARITLQRRNGGGLIAQVRLPLVLLQFD
ncbi:ATP-binding protein [Novosphingobium sp. 1949]|uniref:histidine kinase n=1 Tax=Novosphingobium organovorum TaxID=2930092 RepID=A0ABT0BD16_9SPHN|nr:ATP-binding protein [Novosphingobium organovorum]MCJ2182684.1 ATP-binding protein [Novosphingobium organovorum]